MPNVVPLPPPAPIAAARMSELDVADVFQRRFADKWRYVKEWDAWYEWRGDGWYEDSTGALKASVLDLLREAGNWVEAANLSVPARRALCSNKTANAIASLLAAHRGFSVEPSLFDTDTMLLGVPGGVVDLREGKMLEASPEHYITRRCAVAPAPGQPRLWLSHLERVMLGDAQMIGFIQRYLGYMLSGEVGEHALLFFFGTGRNGKGSIIETIIHIMGDYGYAAPVNLLMEGKQERHPVELAMLRGRRGVSCTEPPQGAKWDDGRIRSLTGGDTVTARLMGENLSSFQPTHKLILMGNHKPTLRSVDEAIRARFNIIDFSVTIPPEERDPKFLEKLRAEWPQILNWMIEGCLHWQEMGLARPANMTAATSAYLEDEDVMGQFIAECCDRGPKLYDAVALLYKTYTNWCERVGERAMTRRLFSNAMNETPGLGRAHRSSSRDISGVAVKAELRPGSINQ